MFAELPLEMPDDPPRRWLQVLTGVAVMVPVTGGIGLAFAYLPMSCDIAAGAVVGWCLALYAAIDLAGRVE